MFIDEKFNAVFHEFLKGKINTDQLACKFRDIFIDELRTAARKTSDSERITHIKRIDNGWRLFVNEKAPILKKDFFRNLLLKNDPDGKFKKALGW